MKSEFFPALKVFLFLTLLTGGVYPLLATGIAQTGFPNQANGSLVEIDGKAVGSSLIAQKFERPWHFWSRPSASDYQTLPSGASNLGPTSQDLKTKIEERRKLGLTHDLLFSSGSGLDPHISPEAAFEQVPRIIGALPVRPENRDAATQSVTALVRENTEDRQWGVFGASRVNVLRLNLSLEDWIKREGLKPSLEKK